MSAPWSNNPMVPKPEPKRRAPLKIIANLEQALNFAKLEKASFGFPTERVRVVYGPKYGQEDSIDGFVKERTRSYRETWLIPQIEEALAWARGES